MASTEDNARSAPPTARWRGGRHAYSADLRHEAAYWYFSATTFTLRRALLPLIRRHVVGRTLDAGAGGLHGRGLLAGHCSEYVSVDVADRHGDVDVIADVQDLRAIGDGAFDCVFCSQVLEHVPDPARALKEFHRVLRPGGRLLVAVPHLSALHEAPHDYFRYTPWGLAHLVESAGFATLEVARAGGLFTFLSHPVSYALNALGWRIPLVRWVVWACNVVVIVLPAAGLDALLRTGRIWPTNVLIVGRRS